MVSLCTSLTIILTSLWYTSFILTDAGHSIVSCKFLSPTVNVFAGLRVVSACSSGGDKARGGELFLALAVHRSGREGCCRSCTPLQKYALIYNSVCVVPCTNCTTCKLLIIRGTTIFFTCYSVCVVLREILIKTYKRIFSSLHMT